MYILVKSGFESGFTLNGNTSILAASMFLDVAGSGGQWKYALFNLSESIIPVGSNNIIQHPSADFHLAIANGVANPTGFRYGYFSDYGSLELGPPKGVCVNDSIRIDAGFGKSSYTWNIGSTHQSIYVKNPGLYKVTVTKGSCTFTDSIQIYQHPEITTPILEDSVEACANEMLILKTIIPYNQYLWYTGSKWPADTPRYTGNYWVEITNDVGCKKKDTIHVHIHPLPQPKIIYNTDLESFCKDSLVVLDAGPGFYSYQWDTGETTQTIITKHNWNDFYKVTVTGEGDCKNSDSISLDCSVIIGLVPNLITANNDGKNDIFYVQYLRHGTWTLEVMNKWGQRVYLNKLYDNSWKPENLSEDVYYFSFRHNKGKKELKGWLHIVNQP
jgi:hypothetical protein